FPSARREPRDFQLMIPFTSRSVVVTGSCEKSCCNIKVIASESSASGEMHRGGLLAAANTPILMRLCRPLAFFAGIGGSFAFPPLFCTGLRDCLGSAEGEGFSFLGL